MAARKQTIGVLGGGQLARMLLEAGGPLGIDIAVLDAAGSPAQQISANANNVTGSFKDPEKIRELARRCDVLTVEIEHVNTDVLEEISTIGVQLASGALKKVPVHPSWKTIRLIQDKFLQKEHYRAAGIPVAHQEAVDGLATGGVESGTASLNAIAGRLGFPFMLKARKESYDGRGNFRVGGPEDLAKAVESMGGQKLYAEAWVPFVAELAVIVVRTEDDEGCLREVHPFVAVETVHEESICSKVYCPPRKVSAAACEAARRVAADVVRTLSGRGIFAVEMFVLKDDSIMVNEVAPRPHNSGHLFIEALPSMSQYKAQLCAILDIFPASAALQPRVPAAVMLNVLGGATPEAHLPLIDKARAAYSDDMDVFLHLYGKDSKPSRKIGHITITAAPGTSAGADWERLIAPYVSEVDRIRRERLDAAVKPLNLSSSLAAKATAVAAAVSPASTVSSASVSSRDTKNPLVVVTMGSDSDLPVLKAAFEILEQFHVPYDFTITSAHRTPHRMVELGQSAAGRGIRVLIAAAGGAAHLPGMLASETTVPVIGVPIKATHLDGQDSLVSIVQMPRGCPVATVGINNSTNAALLAVKILGTSDSAYQKAMAQYMTKMSTEVEAKAERLREIGWKEYLLKR